ncbi:hypothetical protein GGR52DRAFT_430300 [Hypoxylon sp. FL1284]|nr:hypothetical protein GGR52DRAFT_430300 [Hypoxylon sp. FL1284]
MTVSMAADRPTSPAFGYSDPQESKPVSDFTPLPPIRRTSTFDLMTRKKLGGGDEDDNAPSPVGSSDNEIPPAPPMKEGPGYQNGNRQMPNQPLAGQASAQLNQPRNLIQPPPQQHPAFANGSAHAPNGFAPAGGAAQFNGMQQQMLVRRGGPVGPQPVRTQGRPNGTPAHIPGQPSMSQMGGNPVQKLPPGGRQWKLEESYLSEPLKNRPGASSPPQQHQSGFDPYDKETEDGTPQRVARSRPRNNSNNVPPISAGRFPNLFAAPEQPQGPQVGHPVYRGQSNESERQSEQNARDAGLAKEMDVHADEIPDPSGPGEEQRRRGSGIFGLNPPKPSSTWEHDEKPPSMKKRLSELRGMIKGVGNAKDGAKDDQPTKPSTSHVSRPSMQGPIRSQGPGGQGPSPLSQPPLGIGRTGTNESAPAEYQNANGEDEHRKPGGGFLGGLFNKPGSKQPDPKQQPNQPTPSSFQRPPQQFMQPGQQIRPGQMVPEGPPSGQRLVYPSGQPFNGVQPGRPGAMQPVLPDQANPQESIQSPTSPHLVGMAQAVMIRRPSEITVSSQSQAGGPQLSPSRMHQMASQQGPQPGMRAPAGEDVGLSSLRRQIGGGDGDVLVSGALPKPSLGLSHRPSQERLDQGGSSTSNRTTPNRKPVGSGFLRQDGTPTAAAALKYGDSEPRPASAEDERRSSSQLPSGQQSPTLGKIGHVRQTSLPSPGHRVALRSSKMSWQRRPSSSMPLSVAASSRSRVRHANNNDPRPVTRSPRIRYGLCHPAASSRA